ncbi:beta strand repeat-containing protein [Crenothrix sp.]|uniref:beta strand repeat-containing protein n=1 Tax=Crenothrix sp. TaxID=3100433 RepID=UPI00374CC560
MTHKIYGPPLRLWDFVSRLISGSFAAFWLILLFSTSSAQAAQTPFLTEISNSAAATYLDAAGVPRSVTSNTVVTVVQQVASVTLNTDTAHRVSPGTEVTYPVTLANTGNGPDSFTLTQQSSTGALSLTTAVFYADLNGDGVADNNTPITTTPVLQAGEVFNFVVSASAPISATTGQINTLVVKGTSVFASAASDIVTETTTVTNNAVVNTTKAMSATTGAPGTSGYTVSLAYTNTGNAPTPVTLTDVLPAGMTYAANSGRWSVTGATVLTDGTGVDLQGSSPTINYTTSGQTVTGVVSAVAPGQTGTLTFNVNINALPLAAGPLNNTASTTYNDGATPVTVNTNTVTFTVTEVASLTLAGHTIASAPQGSVVTFDNLLTNTGNATDTFDITVPTNGFPAGSSYALYQTGGSVPLTDTNGNGIVDTGPVAVNGTFHVVVKVTLAPGATAGGPFTLTKTATSTNTPTVFVSANDVLTAISANSVDLTNNSAGAAAPGNGPGPEGSAVTSNNALPGTTTTFVLYANNTGPTTDTYNLAASTDSSFAALNLPTDWTVIFHEGSATGPVVTNTGTIAPAASKAIYAVVSIPAGQAAIPAGQAIYFRALSPTTGAVDIKHDEVKITTTRTLSLISPNTGQVAAGSSVVYIHNLTNTGNVSEAISLTLAAKPGFTSVLYIDANNNGIIDPTELPVLTTDALADKTLAPGEFVQLLVKVTADGGLAIGALDTTTLTATSTSGTVNGVVAPTVVKVIDTTTVVDGSIVLLKEQALDAACDGGETVFTTGTITTGAVPGACIVYRITATNSGTVNVTNLLITDNTPVFTKYDSSTPAATTVGSINPPAPANGAAGTITADVGTLTPSKSTVLTFGVKID